MKRFLTVPLLAASSLGFVFTAHSIASPNSDAVQGKPKPEIFVSAFSDWTVTGFSLKGKQRQQIKGDFLVNPVGLATDNNAKLYIANEEQSNVLVYAPPYKGNPVVISDPGYYLTGVAQFNDGQWIAVANVTSTSNGQGNLTIFKNNKLVRAISNQSLYYPAYCAFDSKGNLFVGGQDQNGKPAIGEVVKAAGKGDSLVILGTDNQIQGVSGIQIVDKDKIAILDQSSAIYTYNQPENGKLGSPVYTTSLNGLTLPFSLGFTRNNKSVWVTDWQNADVSEFTYPAGGNSIRTIHNVGNNPGGVVVIPAAKQ